MTTARDVLRKIEEIAGHPIRGEEGVLHGSPDQEISGVTVAWLCSPDAIEVAGEAGHELLISHESFTYPYDAYRKPETPAGWQEWSVNRQRRAMRLAAGQKAGALTWEDIFKTRSPDTADTGALADAIAAASLYDKAQPRVRGDVEQTCLKLIRRGDESRIPEMVDLLNLYGNKTLCEDYLNCNQPDLYQAGVEWAHAHGYSVGSGHGSSRAKWGSGR